MFGEIAASTPTRRQDSNTPPYTAYGTFEAFTHRAASEPVPPQIDKSLLVAWGIAAGNESSLLTSLRSLGFLDDSGHPTELYQQIRLSPPRRAAALQRSLERAYPGLSSDPNATIDANELHDYFVGQRGLTGQMVEKAIRFYRQLKIAAASGGSEPPAPRVAPARNRQPSQMRLEAIELPPPQPTARRPRARPGLGRRPSVPPAISIQVQVPVDVSESDLVDLFGRIQSAWAKSLRTSRQGT